MNVLLTTFGLLLIFGLFSFAQWKNAEMMSFTDAAASSQFETMQEKLSATLWEGADKCYIKEKPKEKKPAQVTDVEDDDAITKPDPIAPSPDDKPIASGRRTQFLHISPLFCDANVSIVEGKGKASLQLLKALIAHLYSEQEFYKEAKEKIPDLEEELILKMRDKAMERLEEELKLSSTNDLSILELHDDTLHHVRWKMLNGNKSRYQEGHLEDTGYYPLSEFVSMRKHPHIMSIWLAPKPVLMALFDNEDVVKELCEKRQAMYLELKSEKIDAADSPKNQRSASKDVKQKDLEEQFKGYIPDSIAQFIDFGVSVNKPPE